MTKRFLYLILLLALLIAACVPSQPAATQPLQASVAVEKTQPVKNTEAGKPAATSQAAEATRAPQAVSPPGEGCTVVSISSQPDPTMQAIFPPVGEKDWVQGPADAFVTIFEYSDFQ